MTLPEDALSRSVRWFILLLILAACSGTRSPSGRDSIPEATARTGTTGLEGSEPGVEFEAPRLIPAIRAQIIELEDSAGATDASVAEFGGAVDTLVSAMQADLNRVGATDAGDFYALRDSVRRSAAGGKSDEIGQVERLIEIYETRMRQAAD
jgi:hypothetical protein